MADLKFIVKAKEYKVKDGDSLDKIAKANGMTWQQLAKFNFGTDDPNEINKFLGGSRIGCKQKTKDKRNYIFTSDDDPGIIYIPENFDGIDYATSKEHTIKLKIPYLKAHIPAKCTVIFWPETSWEGEFGFDWMREGNSTLPGDTDYKTLILPASRFGDLKVAYKSFNIDEANEDGTAFENTTAWINLFPQNECPRNPYEVKFRIIINVTEEEPISLKLKFDLENHENYIEFKDDLPKSIGYHAHHATIKCLKPLEKELVIEVINQTNESNGKVKEIEVGRLIIPANNKDNRATANVVFVPVWTNINGGPVSKVDKPFLEDRKSSLETFSCQALISVNLKTQKFDLTASQSFYGKVQNVFKSIFGIENYAEEFNSKWVVDNPKYDPVRHPKTKVITTNFWNKAGNIHKDLDSAFRKKYPEYKEYFTVFYFNEPGFYNDVKDVWGGLNGEADSTGGTNVVLFEGAPAVSTAHELMHTWGLEHTFDPDAEFTFNEGTTDNIMDYSHRSTPPIRRVALWHWQWKTMLKNLKEKKW